MPGLSIPVRIAAVESNLKCDEELIVRVLTALHGAKGDTFAGSSNATPEGIDTLKRQLEIFLAQKVRHVEEKLALQEEQRRLSQPAAHDPAGAAGCGGDGTAAPLATQGGAPAAAAGARAVSSVPPAVMMVASAQPQAVPEGVDSSSSSSSSSSSNNSSHKIAPHHDGTALRAAIPAAAAAAVVENAPVPTAASSSAPKPSTPVAPSAASPQAAPALHLAGTFSSPAGGASSAVSPGSASAAIGGPTGSAAAGVDGSSPGAAAAPKGKGRARDSHAPTLPSSQAAAGVDSAPPPVSTTATKRKRQGHQQPARAPTATGELGGSCSGGIQNLRATRGKTKKARRSDSNPLDRDVCEPVWKPFHNIVVAAAMLYGTPEQKTVVNHLLKKLATAGAQVSGKNAADLTANLVAKLASTAVQDVKKELKGTYAKPKSARHQETEEDRGALDIFFGRVKMADVCAGDVILTRYLLGDVEQLIAEGHDTRKMIATGFKALIVKCDKPVPPKGFQLESWDDHDGTCVFKWKGKAAGAS